MCVITLSRLMVPPAVTNSRISSFVVRTTVFLADMNEFSAMNETYRKYIVDPPPARATVQVARLPRDVKIEIDAIAVIP